MARRLKAWHWIRTVRAHGPDVASIRSVLFALYLRMNDWGEAYPSHKTIARDTALSERTVGDAIREARRLMWLAATETDRPGQSWKRSYYFACIPDSLDLSQVNLGKNVDLEALTDAIASQVGDIFDRVHGLPADKRRRGAKARPSKGAAKIAASRKNRRKGAATAASGPATDAKGPATDAEKVRQPSPTKFPSKFPNKSPEEGCELSHAPDVTAAPDVIGPIDGSRRADEHDLQIPLAATESNTHLGARDPLDVAKIKAEQLRRAREKVEKVRLACPQFSIEEIARVTGLSYEEVKASLMLAA